MCAYLSPAESYERTNRAEANFELMLHITSMPAALLQITRQNGHGFLSKTYSKLTFISLFPGCNFPSSCQSLLFARPYKWWFLGSRLQWSALPHCWAAQTVIKLELSSCCLWIEEFKRNGTKKGIFFNITDSRFLPLATASKIID